MTLTSDYQLNCLVKEVTNLKTCPVFILKCENLCNTYQGVYAILL